MSYLFHSYLPALKLQATMNLEIANDPEVKAMAKKLDVNVDGNMELRDQTIMFWNLQLQFLEMDFVNLSGILSNLMKSHEQSWDILSIRMKYPKISEQDRMFLATELALHLSGLK
jgi:hypothetical protein